MLWPSTLLRASQAAKYNGRVRVGAFGMALLAPMWIQGSTFEGAVVPFLETHCVSCHGEQMQMADLRLDQLSEEAEAVRHPQVWDDVVRMARAGKMPPPGSTAPSAEEVEAVASWVESRQAAMEPYRAVQPGRVTARRLNRAEYNNTVRDLLLVDLRPADGFPVDDSGYGFDNIGDVLSMSPLLMEMYLDAAGKLARAAIWERPRAAEPTRFRIQAVRDADNPAAIGRVAPYAADGAIRLRHEFPATGFYRFALGAVDRRQRSEDNGRYLEGIEPPPPLLMTMTIDGDRMATKAVEAGQYFDRSERVTHRITAGKRDIWLGFIDFEGKPMDPNAGFGTRKVWVDYLEVNGPFDAEPIPLPASHRRIVACRPVGEEPWRPCAERIVRTLARRAFRRPPTEHEVHRFMRLAEASMRGGNSFEGTVRTVLQAVLVSPEFLFRIERGADGPASQGEQAIGSFELATRMSYFLWSSMPDDELLEAAAAGLAGSPDAIAAQVRRMLADPKSSALVENFAGQWLQLRNLAQAQPDSDRFPDFDEPLRDAMRKETELFFESILREDRSVLEFLDSDFSYLNGRLAAHYGIPGVAGDSFRRVELPNRDRGGLLGQASVLTVSSYPTRTSPVLRGLWVLENILGQSPPPPPPGVPELEVREGKISGTLREQLEEHRANEGCMSCHLVMDAIGFGLENYDAVGRWRTTDSGLPVDSSGTLPGGHSFDAPDQLRRILLDTEAESFARTLAKKLLTYALGRGVDRRDNPAINEILARLAESDYRFSALVQGIINSKPFRVRASEPLPESSGT